MQLEVCQIDSNLSSVHYLFLKLNEKSLYNYAIIRIIIC